MENASAVAHYILLFIILFFFNPCLTEIKNLFFKRNLAKRAAEMTTNKKHNNVISQETNKTGIEYR